MIARTTVMYYKRAGLPVRRIAAELNVDYVVEGSVRCEGERVRVTAHVAQRPVGEHAPAPAVRAARKRWADLPRRVYDVDPLVCP